MLTTAKNMQLMDASGVNISPVTDITSLYYEVAEKANNDSEDQIVVRKYVYSGFPVSVNLDPTDKTDLATSDYHYDPSINTPYYRLVDNAGKDIIVSNISTSLIPGTTYRQINVQHYNLSQMLTHYTTRELFDASIHVLDTSLNIQDASITHLYNSITSIEIDINTTITYVPNKFYLVKYYVGADGIMDIPGDQYSGPSKTEAITLLIRACDSSALDYNLYNMYDHLGNSLDVHGKYDIIDNAGSKKIRITWLKDKYGNEAPYDFYNLTYTPADTNKNNYTFTYVGGEGTYYNENALLKPTFKDKIRNNIIKTNPFNDNTNMIIFRMCQNGGNNKIENNYIGNNNQIFVTGSTVIFYNNIIHNFNNIALYEDIGDMTSSHNIKLSNAIINNGNDIGAKDINADKITIKNNNVIEFKIESPLTFDNLIIGSNNALTLYPNRSYRSYVSNATVLDNCKGTMCLSDYTVIDGYNDTTNSFDTESNSVYLFNQNVYAKSFNTLR